MFRADIIEDSISPQGDRLVTFSLEYPRFIHSEVMTHRVFSRNAASSRAIPVARMLRQVREDPAMPIHWGRNQPGMQANEEHDAPVVINGDPGTVQEAWRVSAHFAALMAEAMADAGYHKQVANRLLEPFQWMRAVVSATDWDNFFALRCHPDAQPEFQCLASMMRVAIQESTPIRRVLHLPFVRMEERGQLDEQTLMMISSARCARVSYLTHEGKEPVISDDLKLYHRLVGSDPIHASPTEHPSEAGEAGARYANFHGWRQHRWSIEQRLLEGVSP